MKSEEGLLRPFLANKTNIIFFKTIYRFIGTLNMEIVIALLYAGNQSL